MAGLIGMRPAVRWLLIAAGWLALALGLLGVVLPLLPTTPFVLLAAACFARSSFRCHAWLLRTPVFGPALADWQAGRGVSTRVRVVALLMLWSGIAMAVVARDMPLLVECALVVIAAMVSTVILQLPAAASARHPGGPGPHVAQARRIR